MAKPAQPPPSKALRGRRYALVPGFLAAMMFAIPLGGCSFDLGSWGSDKEKPLQQIEPKPTDNSARSVPDAQGYAARGQVLADTVAKVESCSGLNFWRELEARREQ